MSASELERLTQFLYLVPVGLIQTADDGAIQQMNPLANGLVMALTRGQPPTNAFAIFSGVLPDIAARVAAQPKRGMIMDQAEFEIDPDGDQTFSLTLHRVDEDQLAFVINDISELIRQRRRILRDETQLRAIVNNVRTHMIVPLDARGRISEFNPSIARLTGLDEAVLGQMFSRLFLNPLDDTQLLTDARNEGWTEIGALMQQEQGKFWWGDSVLTRVPDEKDQTVGYALVTRENNERHAYQQQLEEWATRDPLTNLLNRRAFEEIIEAELSRANRHGVNTCLLILDVDFFKRINDTHGHDVGDEVLVEIAQRINRAKRGSDYVVRLGGEEFGLLLPETDAEQALVFANRLRQTLAATPIKTAAGDISLTISAGAVQRSAVVDSFADMYSAADAALYRAKQGGRNRVEVAASTQL